ncbi:MAG: hypothetical protein AAGI07_08530 [Bacteroidota bacterium]
MKNLKKYVIAIVCIVFSLPILAQDNNNPNNTSETLFGKKIPFGVAVTVFYNGSGVDGDFTHAGGARLGLVFNNNLSVGGFYQGSGEIRPDSEVNLDNNFYMDMRIGGGYIEYTLQPTKLVHFTFPLMIGIGEVEIDSDSYDSFSNESFGEDNFVVVEPQALVEINLHKNLKLNAGVGYRWASDVNYRQITNQDLSSLTGTIGLKVGLFR